MRARRTAFAFATLAAAGCAAVLGIEDGHLREGGVDAGDDVASDGAIPPPPPPNMDGSTGDDSATDSGGDCPRTVVDLVTTANTYVDLSAGPDAAYGDLSTSTVNIGYQDARALFRFEIEAGVSTKLVDVRTVATLIVTAPDGGNSLNLTDGPMQILAATSNWDELTASYAFRSQVGAAMSWDMPGVGGADRGPELGGAPITGLSTAGGVYDVPLGYIARASGWMQGSELTLLAIADPDSGVADGGHLRMFVQGRQTAAPAILRVSFCTP